MNRNVPPFLNKLYNMVNEPQSNSMICWSDAGDTFIVQRQQDFAKQVLPRFFKHGNFSSFVRQLNMYGFHKVPHLQQGAMEGSLDRLEFSNPHFKRDQPDLLLLVSRKKGSRDTENPENRSPTSTDLQHLLDEMAAIKKHQLMVSTDLKQIQSDSQLLWQETLAARERYQQQQDTIDKILHFLASVFSEKSNNGITRKRPFLLGNIDNDEDVKTVSPLKLARTDKSDRSSFMLDSLMSLATQPSLRSKKLVEEGEKEDKESMATTTTTTPILNPEGEMVMMSKPLDLSTTTTTSQNSNNVASLTHPTYYNNNDLTAAGTVATDDVFLSRAEHEMMTASAPPPLMTKVVSDHIDSVNSISESIDQLGSNIDALVQELGFDSNSLWDLDSYLQSNNNNITP